MFGRVENLYLARTSNIFQMIRTARQVQNQDTNIKQRTTPVTVLLLALALEDRPEINMDAVSESWIADNLSRLCDIMSQRLRTWRGGLAEVPDFISSEYIRRQCSSANEDSLGSGVPSSHC